MLLQILRMNKIYLIRSFVISLFLVFSYFIGDAQNSSGFKNLSVRDGLSQGWVQKIIQDHNGYMWFATNDGLNKYDGNKFTIYQHEPQDSLSLLSSFVTALCEDSIGNIWVGMNHGLGMYNYKTDQIEGIDLGGDYFVTNIFLNGNEELVISSFFGIFIYNFTDKNIERFLIEDQPVETFHNRFRVVTPFQSGLITFTDNGIFYFDYKTRTFSKYFDLPDGFKGGGVRSATIIDSALWIGYLDNGLAYIDLKFSNELKFETLDDLADNTIFAIIKYNNKLVIGTENNGLYYLESLGTGAKFQVTARVNNDASNPMGLSSNSVHSFCIDKQKNLWIGTYNGVSYTYGNVLDFRSITRQIGENSLVNSMVSSIVELDDMLWLGTEDGIDIFTKQGNKQGRLSFSEDANRNSLQGKAILAMEFDDAGNVWAGSWSGGIDVIDSERNIIKRYSTGETSQDLANETIMCIEKDAEGNMLSLIQI